MYRLLTDEEIALLEDHGCQAENWEAIMVAEDFKPTYVHDVTFYGDIQLGVFEKNIEVSRGFLKHSGLRNATLRNVCIGDNSLVENIGNYINNYTIGEECYISNVSTMETTEGATYGEGNLISVLNEVGEGNITLFGGLNSQLAAFMVKHNADRELRERLRQMIGEELKRTLPERGTIGFGVKIVNTREVVNTIVQDNCEVNGAARLFDCSLLSVAGTGVYVGSGVICENSIVADGSSITNDCNLQDCFVGEACQLTNGFTASGSVFFANSYMSNGEACAAFCGPFTASHHKSSLLIGAMFSFYNAGSATNFSNHAYKLMHHPDTRNVPFSYLIAYGDIMYLVPGRNLNTVGLYRDIHKWPKRDIRPRSGQKSIVNFEWLSPFTVNEMLQGKQILEKLREAQGEMVAEYNFRGYVITNNSLNIGLRNYDMAIKMFLARCVEKYGPNEPASTTGWRQWSDLSGLLLPESEELRLIEEIKNREITNIQSVTDRFGEIGERYEQYEWAFAYRLINEYYSIAQPTHADWQEIIDQGREAKQQWIATIKEDALKEYNLGDVEEDVYRGFMEQLNKETE